MLSILGGCLIGGACRAWVNDHAPTIKVMIGIAKMKIKGSHY